MNPMRCWGGTILVLALAAGSSTAGRPPLRRFEFTEPHMGTLFRIVFYARSGPLADSEAKHAAAAAFQRIADLDSIMSDYRPTSELMELGRHAGGPPVRVSADLFRVLAWSQEVARRSHGAFDVTVGPVVRLWRRARRLHELPDPKRLAGARELVSFVKLRLDPRARTAQLLEPGMRLDLGGIAKGDAADEALLVLKQRGLRQALVAAAGDITVGDPPPGRAGWTIAIAPLDPAAAPARSIVLHNAAVSTSGDAEQFVELGGTRYSHIINPRTGMALTGRYSVTIVARRGITADSLATAVCVMEPARGLALVDATDDAAALIVRLTPQGIQTLESKRWAPEHGTRKPRIESRPS